VLHGWIILDKPLRLGSTAGVSAVKRALRDGGYTRVKVGHGGTLDPLATGVLPIAVGEATKLAGRMLDSDKIYEFTIAFGKETDSLDLEGAVIAESDVRPLLVQVEAVLPCFTGTIEQIPPAYSALKVDGKRAYDLARAGEVVELAARAVTVYSLSISPGALWEVDGVGGREARTGGPFDNRRPSPYAEGVRLASVTLTTHVSKGTYIRSLARDIARACGTVGHIIQLRRTKAGPFNLAQAISLDKLAEHAKALTLEDITLPLRTALDDIPALALTPEQARLIHHGRVLTGIAAPNGLTLAMLDETPVALVDVLGGTVKVERGFNL
jgi:tRNA pseudouridine55 synthase